MPFFGAFNDNPYDNSYAIVMEYATNGCLFDYLKQHPDGEFALTGQNLQWAEDIALGLNYLHNICVIHLDLKSPNGLCVHAHCVWCVCACGSWCVHVVHGVCACGAWCVRVMHGGCVRVVHGVCMWCMVCVCVWFMVCVCGAWWVCACAWCMVRVFVWSMVCVCDAWCMCLCVSTCLSACLCVCNSVCA